MAIPLVSEVFLGARSVLGDTKTVAGEVYTDALLAPHFSSAFDELYRALSAASNPLVNEHGYYNVPSNTGYIDPVLAGIENLGEIQALFERGTVTAYTITAVTPGNGSCVLTVTPATTLVTGNQAVVYNVGGITFDINDEWTVTVLSSTSIRLNGCTATGTYTSGGVLSTSTEQFLEMIPVRDFEQAGIAPSTIFQIYSYERGVIRVPPVSSVRQLKINYLISGDAPTATTASVGIDDSLEFFKYRVAGQASLAKSMLARASLYNNRAVGPRWDTEQSPGGILASLLMNGVRNLQRLPPELRRPPMWRQHRSRAIW